jgi:hypothetical protein
MMNPTKVLRSLILSLSAIATTALIIPPQVEAVNFQEQRVNSDTINVVAVPFGYEEHRLEIIEQIPGQQQCWSESGQNPVQVNMLLLNFDHTNSCRRITDTNGYTLRLNGREERVAHVIKIVENNGELQLVAFHKDPSQPNLVIGRTNGLSSNAMKIILNPGWQITKQVYDGQVLNRVYLSGDNTVAQNYYQPGVGSSTNVTSSNIRSNTTTPNTPQAIDTTTLINGVSQIYQNVVNPLLQNLAPPANQPSQPPVTPANPSN